MRYCQRCLYPENHPLGILFDEAGVCSGCRVHEEKDTLDWRSRKEKLKKIVEAYRSPGGTNYDCIVPVSGGRDSYFIIHTVKHELGLNPLLVSYNKQYNSKAGIRNLEYLRTIFDCDLVGSTVSPAFAKRLVRHTLERMGSLYWHNHAGTTVFPVQIAARLKIPLIIWGAQQGTEQVGMFSHLNEVEMTRRYRKEHDLLGFEAEDLVDASLGLPEREMQRFIYPSDREIRAVGIRGIYLNNYMRWDSKTQHESMIRHYGYETLPQTRTYNPYDDVDCLLYSDLHDYIKFAKFGYGKATDHACIDIRLKRLSREAALERIARYPSIEPRRLAGFLEWADLSAAEFHRAIDRFRDPAIWDKSDGGDWKLRDSVSEHTEDPGVGAARLPVTGDCQYQETGPRDRQSVEDDFILMQKGFVPGVSA